MGWGTNFNVDIFINKQTFNSILNVKDKIDENVKYINDAKTKIEMFVSATPSSIIPNDWNEEPIRWLNNEVELLFEEIESLTKENVLLYLYVEYLEDENEKKLKE